MKVLKHHQQVKVDSFRFQPVILVGTQKGYYDEHAESNLKYGYVYEEKIDEDYAYTIKSPSILTADYPGKAKEMQAKRERYAAAVSLEDDETVEIDGRLFKVVITGENYSDPIHFKELK